MLLALSVLAVPVMLVSLVRFHDRPRLWIFVAVHLAIVALLWTLSLKRRSCPLAVKATLLIGFWLAMCALAYGFIGLASAGPLFGLFAFASTYLFYGARATVAMIVAVLAIIALSFFVQAGGHSPVRIDIAAYALAPASWLLQGMAVIVTGAALIAVVRVILQHFSRALEGDLAREAAERATRAKSQFLANMSHEIRTPINGVLGYLDLLQQGTLDAQQREHAAQARAAGELLLAIINDILDVSRIDAGKLRLERVAASPMALAESAAALLRPQATEKRLQISVTAAADLPEWIETDPTRLRQILINLLSNAVKFTDRGEIRVELSRAGTPAAPLLRIVVADPGIGIAPDQQARLFTEFSQLDTDVTRQLTGTGLGLAICRRLAEALGGDIGVDSRPGEGSRFWFTVALTETARPAPVLAAPPPARAGGTILLVEDNPMNQRLASAILQRAGHQVRIVDSGEAAVEAAAAGGCDLILMDVRLPGISGVAAAQAIRALPGAAGQVPIIALSAQVMPEEVQHCLAAGMNGHLGKPIERAELLATVARFVAPAGTPDGP